MTITSSITSIHPVVSYLTTFGELTADDQAFLLDKAYAETLTRKRMIFQRQTRTRKTIFLTLITTFGVKSNAYATSLIQS